MYTIEDMEGHIDPIVLGYIRDNYFNREFVGTKIEELEKTKNGTRFKSTYDIPKVGSEVQR
jgi:hypothetical protein